MLDDNPFTLHVIWQPYMVNTNYARARQVEFTQHTGVKSMQWMSKALRVQLLPSTAFP